LCGSTLLIFVGSTLLTFGCCQLRNTPYEIYFTSPASGSMPDKSVLFRLVY
jgi:hypothetical protein